MQKMLFLTVFLMFSKAHASRVTELPSSIFMRDVSSSLKELCAGAKQNCFQLNYTVDPYANDESAIAALKAGVAKDTFLKMKFAAVEPSALGRVLKEILAEAQVGKSASTVAQYRLLLEQLAALKKNQKLTAFEALGFGPIAHERYLILFMHNSRFDLGEALVFGASDKVYMGGF